MSDRHLLSMLSAWWRLASVMVEVSIDSAPYHDIILISSIATTPSEGHRNCLYEVQEISRATLFAPVLHCEAVQAMSE
jgi:hypothetical protein